MDVVNDELARLGATLVEERVLRRLIKSHRKIRGVGLQVPHEQCYTLPRAELESLAERGDLAVDTAALPEQVILVTGDRAKLAAGGADALSRLWRTLFHAEVHRRFDALVASGALTLEIVRARIDRVGQTEFDEIRSVLRQEGLLLPPVDDTTMYVEFVALYLELRYFAPHAVARTFPAVFDLPNVDATIALDVDGDAILAASRPPRGPEHPLITTGPGTGHLVEEPRPVHLDPSAKKAAARARRRGNRARAAILAAKAGDSTAAIEDLEALSERLARALTPGDGSGSITGGWAKALSPVAHHAATSQRGLRFEPAARLLHDLQAACVIAEREDKVVDVITWALSRGKRPVVRALPATREVRVAKRMHRALAKVPACGIGSPEARERLTALLRDLAERADANVRTALRPKLEAAFDAVELHPHSLPERVAEKKLVDELLDRAVAVGRMSLPDLRDAISRNDLKMADLSVREVRTGDQLLRCDRLLSTSIDGVYRRGEAYLRFLQWVSALLFGTRIGRFLTLYLMLPLLGSYAVVEGLQHMVGPVAKWGWNVEVVIATPESLYGGAAALFLLLHVWPVRRGVILVFRGLWLVIRTVLWDIPRAVWRHPWMQRLLDSGFVRWVLRPAIPAAITAVVVPGWWRWPIAGGVFALFAVGLNLRFGRLVEEIVVDWVVRSGRQLMTRIIPGLVKYVLAFFEKLLELSDRAIYKVDEWLRFRTGQSFIVLAIKGLLGTVWFFITYILRLYINLFVEPTVNPIKHFPVVTVAAKIIVPFIPAILSAVAGPASSLMGTALGNSFAAFTVIVLPGLAGFLVWELKENWKLYRATRPRTLRALAIGHHGETMASFLKPGFHSGTIPKLYTKLRRAAWRDNERLVAKHRETLHHVEEAIATFADRQLVSMLNEVPSFHATDVALDHVEIGSNRIQITLACPSVGPETAAIRFEQQSGWLVASMPVTGWTDRLTDDQRAIFEIALAGFYKLSGVDILREQLEHALGDGGPPPRYDIADAGLLVWPDAAYQVEIIYPLRTNRMRPAVRGPKEAVKIARIPDLAGRHAIFGKEPLYWAIWSTTWRQIARGDHPMQIITGPSLLRRATHG